MDLPSYDISPEQNRELHQLCWRFEPRLLSDAPPSPEEWLAQRGRIPAEVVIREFLAIRAEFTGDQQQNDAAKLHSEVASAWQTECLRLLPDQQDLVNRIFDDHRSIELQAPSPSEAELLESRLNDERYQFVEEIDRGGTGAVWRVYDRHLRRETAVKVLLHSRISESSQQRLRQEARLCGRLSHPGIVPVYELGTFDDGRPFITMKLIRGQTLASRLKSLGENDDRTELVEYVLNVCDAIGYAHANNIIHRDLKPANIMVGEFGEVQVMDWGLGKELSLNPPPATAGKPIPLPAAKPRLPSGAESEKKNEDGRVVPTRERVDVSKDETIPAEDAFQLTRPVTIAGTVFGTLAYMPPEQTEGDPALIDKPSDVFALGAILCETLTGKPPYVADSSNELLKLASTAQLDDAFQRLDNVDQPHDLIELTKRCLSPDPNQRPADASRLAELIRRCETTRVERVQAAEDLTRQRQRNRLIKWCSAAIVAALLVSVFVGYKYITEKSTRIADQTNAERDRLEREILQGTRIRDSIKAAQKYSAIAATLPQHEQHSEWLLAVKEIEKAETYVAEVTDDDLKKEFHLLADDVRVNLATATRLRDRYLKDDECRQELFRLIEQSYYPESMRLTRWVDLLPKFREAYARVGIEPGVISRSAIDRLQNSEFRSELIHGLMVWWRESRFQLSYGDGTTHSRREIDSLGEWITLLIDRADTDPLRTEIRRNMRDRRFDEVLELLKQDEAVASLLTIHTAAMCFSYPNIEPEDQLAFLLRAQQRFPQDFFVNWYLPVSAGSIDNKRTFALACYSLRPENPAVLGTLGRTYLAENKPHRAIETFKELLQLAPWSHLAHRNLATAYDAIDDVENAAAQNELADQLLASVRDNFENRIAHLRKMKHSKLAAKLETYLKEVEQVQVAVTPNAQPQPLSEADLAKQAKLNQDINDRLAMLSRAPGNQGHHGKLSVYYLALCELLYDAGHHDLVEDTIDRAIVDFRKLSQRAPTVATPHERLSVICGTYGRYESAIESTKAAIAIHPSYGAHYKRLGELYNALCQQHRTNREPELFAQTVEKAIADLDQLSLHANGETTAPHESLARFCERHRRYAEGVEAFKRILSLLPGNEHFRKKLGEMHLALGRHWLGAGRKKDANTSFDSAIVVFSEWVQESPENVSAHELLSVAQECRGNFEEARKHLKIALGMHPEYQPQLDHYAELTVAQVQQVDEDDPSTKIRLLTEALAFLNPSGTNHARLLPIFDELSSACHQTGQHNEALESLDFVIAQRPGDHALQERLAWLYVATNQSEKAATVFDRLLKASPYDEQVIETVAKFHIHGKEFAKAENILNTAHAQGVTSPALRKLRQDLTKRAAQPL